MSYKRMGRTSYDKNNHQYLIRTSNLSLEQLKARLSDKGIEYHVLNQGFNKSYFRDTIINTKRELPSLLSDPFIIPSHPLTRYDSLEDCIEIKAVYNFLIRQGNKEEIKQDENHILITKEIARNLGIDEGGVPRGQPMDRIRIYKISD